MQQLLFIMIKYCNIHSKNKICRKTEKLTGNFLPGYYPLLTFPLTLKYNTMQCINQIMDKHRYGKLLHINKVHRALYFTNFCVLLLKVTFPTTVQQNFALKCIFLESYGEIISSSHSVGLSACQSPRKCSLTLEALAWQAPSSHA